MPQNKITMKNIKLFTNWKENTSPLLVLQMIANGEFSNTIYTQPKL